MQIYEPIRDMVIMTTSVMLGITQSTIISQLGLVERCPTFLQIEPYRKFLVGNLT